MEVMGAGVIGTFSVMPGELGALTLTCWLVGVPVVRVGTHIPMCPGFQPAHLTFHWHKTMTDKWQVMRVV